jgi:hypothetical protein
VVRFFAADTLPDDICDDPRMVEKAYAAGVPMGGELPAPDSSPAFLASAARDPGIPGSPGLDLQRIQVVKGWLDDAGNTHEKVYDIAGNADNGAGVDPQTCAPTGSGHAALCAVWRDPQYDAGESAFYYVRVLENPSCRWSTLQCQAAGVNPFATDCADQAARKNEEMKERGAIGEVYTRCCLNPDDQPFYSPVIQERAWPSPIWINPGDT